MVIKVESLPPLLDANQQKYFDELRQMRAAETNGALPLAPKIGTREALREEYYRVDAELDELLKLPSWTVDIEDRIKELQVQWRDLRVSLMNEDIGNNVESQGTSTQEGDNKSQLTSTFGASKTNPNAISSSLGALSPANLNEIMRTVKQHMGTRPKANPWLTSLEFFANMAAAASQRGATALGAAGTAGATTVKTLLEERKAKRAEELAATQMGLTLAATLGKGGSWKVGAPRGEQAYYMSADKAKKYFIDKGLDPASPNFDRLVKYLKPPTPEFEGKPIIKHDAFIEMIPLIRNNKLYDYNINPMKDPKPRSAAWFKKRMALLAKDDKWVSTVTEVIPQVQRGLDILLSGEAGTGILEKLTLGLRQAWQEAFGTEISPEVINARSLQSLSFFLAPKMRPKGSGSTSDMEFKAYQKAILEIGNPALANYISLYTFMKTQQNAAKAHELETEILTGGGTALMATKAINRMDRGLYEKYTGDVDDDAALEEWHDSLPRGALIFNRDADGNKLWGKDADGKKVGLFIVKGWGR